MSDKLHQLIEELYKSSHRFLLENEVLDVAERYNLSLFDTNFILKTLIDKGVYISETAKDAIKENKNEIRALKGTRKTPEAPLTFEMINIPVGSKLTFLKDKKVVAITLDNINKIELEDGSLKGTISALAQILAVKYGFADVARQGARWWLYDKKTLLAIRSELENGREIK